MTIKVQNREEMLEIIYGLVTRGLMFKAYQKGEDYEIILSGGY